MDRIDHACLWIIKICLVILFMALPLAVESSEEDNKGDSDFFFACSGGKLEGVKTAIEAHPSVYIYVLTCHVCSSTPRDETTDSCFLCFCFVCILYVPAWINAQTDNGESCLHLTGIYGYSEVTEYLLVKGADPNIRSTYEQGLRMHPLSWNIYGGHVANVAVLLRYGVDVNLDFDSMGEKEPVTALDVALQLTQNEEGDERFVQLEELLRKHGGKTTEELRGEKEKQEL